MSLRNAPHKPSRSLGAVGRVGSVFKSLSRSKSLAKSFLLMLTAGLMTSPMIGPTRAQDAPDRVLTIGGAVTEIVFALEQQHRLIARDSTSMFPSEALALPDVGYMRALSPEGVLSVEPDLILARANSGPPEAIEVLQAAQVDWVTVPDDFTPQGIDENIRLIAEALGVPKRGAQLRDRLAADLAVTSELTEGIAEPARVLFVLSLREGRVLASGTGTAAHGIITLAGADNVLSAFDGYKEMSDEALISANPDVILMMEGRDESDHGSPNEQILNHPALGVTNAAQSGAIIRMDGLYLLGFGPRTGQAARDLARAIYDDRL